MSSTSAHPWQRAAAFAARFHQGQFRRDGRTPYVSHPFRVAMTVRDIFGIDDPVALTAALLHDVIEDTTADYDDVQKEFGVQVADVVAALTKDMRRPNDQRETEYDRTLAAAPWQARLIKLADVYDNVSDCANESMKTKAIGKARRALAIAKAAGEPQLEIAIERVQSLIADSG